LKLGKLKNTFRQEAVKAKNLEEVTAAYNKAKEGATKLMTDTKTSMEK
jgi:hypothetical protein